jgi:KDO2-lipid IV(A) lauroyltransferase
MAKKSAHIIQIEYLAAKLVFTLMGLLPRKLAVSVGIAIARLGFPFAGKLRRIAHRNLEIAFPEMNAEEREKIVRGTFRNLGRQIGEFAQFPKHTKESLADLVDFPISDEVWKKYRKLKDDGRGVIFLTPHLGSWELLALAASALIEPQKYLVRRLDNPKLEKVTGEMRGRFGNIPIDKSEALMPALKLLRGGGNLGILADLNSQEKEGVFVPFFGVPACTSAGVAVLAMRTKAVAVVLGAPWDEQKQKYVVEVGELVEFKSTGDRGQDVIDFTAAFVAEIEKMIRKHPDQWFWIHQRWKTRPAGEPSLYDFSSR